MKKLLILVAVVIGVTVWIGTALATGSKDQRRGRAAVAKAAPPAFVGALASAIARESHGSGAAPGAAISAQWVLTNRASADAVDSGDTPDSNQPVYYVVMHGHFVADKGAFLSPGAAPPRGTVLGFTVDATTHEILDFSLSGNPRAIGKLGAAKSFDVAG